MKRILSLVLAVLLTLSIVPVMTVQAAETDDIRVAVTEAYNELLAITSPGEGGASDGAMQLLSHALFGGGEDLIMDESDNFTGMLLRSNMFRDGVIDALTESFIRLLDNYNSKMFVGNSYNFYDHKMTYGCYSFPSLDDFVEFENSDGEDSGPSSARQETMKLVRQWAGTKNTCDDALILVVGNCRLRILIEKCSASNNTAKYKISLCFWDIFDFGSGNYEGSNTQLATALTWFGRLMQLGAVVKPYHFEVHLDFDIAFDNTCSHQTETFLWEHDGTDLIPATGNGVATNNLTRLEYYHPTRNEYLGDYYQLDNAIRLKHNLPWTVEFQTKKSNFFLGPRDMANIAGSPYLVKLTNHCAGAETFNYPGISDTGEETTLTGRNLYGVNYAEAGFRNSQTHTYCLENRVSGDSNMVYLTIDGQELGPMNGFYIYKAGAYEHQEEPVDWFNGKDIEVNYIFNKTFRINPDYPVEYVQIWENGKGNEAHSYYTTSTVAPTCTGKGYTAHVCAQCGDTWKDNFIDPLGHRFGDWEAKDDTLHIRTCSVCGEETVDAHSFVDGACTVCGYKNHASVEGAWTTDFVMPAADLGVSAPDAVLRATLIFGEDGTASCTWEAVDLTAFRIFFHDMFVNSYYALGYGLGITDFNEIEILCRESTGLGVSEYMDTIVTDEAIIAAFSPASTSGTYSYNADHTAIFTDLAIMEVPSDPTVENSFVLGGNTLYLNADSWDKPDYTFVCTAK